MRKDLSPRIRPWMALVLSICFGLAVAAEPLQVRRGDFTGHFLLTGELVAEDAVPMVVPNANIWPVQVRWLAEDGVEVEEGEVIVEFDNSQLTGSLEELERTAREARNELASLSATVRTEELSAALKLEQVKAKVEKALLDARIPEDLLAKKEYDERQLELDRSRLELEEAEAALALKRESVRAKITRQQVALDQAEALAEVAREGIELLTLRSPRDGILLVSEHPEEGRAFQTGDSTWPGTTIASLPDLSSMIVEAQLFDVDDGRIRPGMPVEAILDAFPETPLEGEILDIENIAHQTVRFSMRRAFRTRIRVEGLDLDRMRPGMSVRIQVEERIENALLVPRRALRWSETEGRAQVEARLAEGSFEAVDLGPCNHEICVVEEGVEEGALLASTSARGAP